MVLDDPVNVMVAHIGKGHIVSLEERKTGIVVLKIERFPHARRHLVNKTKNTFSFASKIDTLLCQPYVKSAVDEEGLYEIFMLGPAKTIGKAIFKDICELPPAFCLTYKNGEIKTYPYWKLEAKEFNENEETAAEHTYLLVKDSIERQLVSDVPLATFLSGGLDSSIISKIASDKYKESGKTLDTYSVDYTCLLYTSPSPRDRG